MILGQQPDKMMSAALSLHGTYSMDDWKQNNFLHAPLTNGEELLVKTGALDYPSL